MNNLKTHLKGIRNVLLCYLLTVLLSWAAFPIIVIVLSGIATPDFCFCVYTVFCTVILAVITYIIMHGYGEEDTKPYRYARYPLKGLAVAAMAYIVIIGLEHLMISYANKNVIVHHPTFAIETLNGYVRLILFMPFYWLFRVIEGPQTGICPVPSVTYLNCVIPGAIVLAVSCFGYLMGFTGHRIFKGEIKNKFLRQLLYPKPKHVREEDKRREKEKKKV